MKMENFRSMNGVEWAVIKGIPLFNQLPDKVAQELLANAHPKDFPKGKVLFLRGEPAETFYIVLSGWVKVYRETAEGDEAVIGVFTEGECLAEAAAFLGHTYPASAQVAEDARLLPVLSGPFRNHVAKMPEIAMNMLASMSKRMHHLVKEVEQLKTSSATGRVVDFLLKRCPVDSGPAVVALPYDKTLISRRLGIQPESLSRILAKLRKVGVKTEQNRIVIADTAVLKGYVNGASDSQPAVMC